jgi:hypothetical protein
MRAVLPLAVAASLPQAHTDSATAERRELPRGDRCGEDAGVRDVMRDNVRRPGMRGILTHQGPIG